MAKKKYSEMTAAEIAALTEDEARDALELDLVNPVTGKIHLDDPEDEKRLLKAFKIGEK